MPACNIRHQLSKVVKGKTTGHSNRAGFLGDDDDDDCDDGDGEDGGDDGDDDDDDDDGGDDDDDDGFLVNQNNEGDNHVKCLLLLYQLDFDDEER